MKYLLCYTEKYDDGKNMKVESDDKLLSEMKEAYKACPAAIKYCNDLKIPAEKIDENIVKIFDFVSGSVFLLRAQRVNRLRGYPLEIFDFVSGLPRFHYL